MEKKTKHRILGSLVLIGLVVILLPFFQGGSSNNKELAVETTQVKAPPFPDQFTQEALANESDMADDDIIKPVLAQKPSPIPLPATIQSDKKTVATFAEDDTGTQLGDDVVQINKTGSVTRKPVVSSSAQVNSQAIQPSALKNNAWVIQLGSFKDKTNALRLVNRLRSNGYPAFIQKVATTFGEHTRVYVGPQSEKESAKALAQKLEDEFYVRAIVISYKPLTL